MRDVDTAHDQRMRAALAGALETVRDHLPQLRPRARLSRIGRIVEVGDGVATIHGLQRPVAGELIEVGGVAALAEELREDEVRAVLLGSSLGIEVGMTARPLGRELEVPAGFELIGRVIDPLGHPLDGRGPLSGRHRIPVERDPIPLLDREPVSRPLRTGVFTLDTMLPIGRGQRQLVIGDRSTGKTELCLDILVAAADDIVPIYVAIGRRGSETAAHLKWLRDRGMFEHGFAVVTDADDPIGLIHLTPYAATAMAEDLALRGHDVVVVYDDLTHHAHTHRTMALLLGRPVGREAHPVDVFYAHARMLERATQLGDARGNGSLTAFPIVETQAGDLTAYIPTNLVSITDGQIRLDLSLVAADIMPAVDVGLSVSRVGGKAQPELLRKLAGTFKNRYAQFLELESFARFGTRLEASAQRVIDWGRRVRQVLRQGRGQPRSWSWTTAALLVVQHEHFTRIPLDSVGARIDEIVERVMEDPRFDRTAIEAGRAGPDATPRLRTVVEEIWTETMQATPAQEGTRS